MEFEAIMNGLYGHNSRNAGFHDLEDLRAARARLETTAMLARAAGSREKADQRRHSRSGYARMLERDIGTGTSYERERTVHRDLTRLRDEIAELEYDLGDDGYNDIDGD